MKIPLAMQLTPPTFVMTQRTPTLILFDKKSPRLPNDPKNYIRYHRSAGKAPGNHPYLKVPSRSMDNWVRSVLSRPGELSYSRV